MWTEYPILTVREFVEINKLELEIKAPPTVELNEDGSVKGRGPEIVVAVIRNTEVCEAAHDVYAEPGVPVGLGKTVGGALKSLALQLSGRTLYSEERFIEVPHLA